MVQAEASHSTIIWVWVFRTTLSIIILCVAVILLFVLSSEYCELFKTMSSLHSLVFLDSTDQCLHLGNIGLNA